MARLPYDLPLHCIAQSTAQHNGENRIVRASRDQQGSASCLGEEQGCAGVDQVPLSLGSPAVSGYHPGHPPGCRPTSELPGARPMRTSLLHGRGAGCGRRGLQHTAVIMNTCGDGCRLLQAPPYPCRAARHGRSKKHPNADVSCFPHERWRNALLVSWKMSRLSGVRNLEADHRDLGSAETATGQEESAKMARWLKMWLLLISRISPLLLHVSSHRRLNTAVPSRAATCSTRRSRGGKSQSGWPRTKCNVRIYISRTGQVLAQIEGCRSP